MLGEDVVVELRYQGRANCLILNVGLNDWMTMEENEG